MYWLEDTGRNIISELALSMFNHITGDATIIKRQKMYYIYIFIETHLNFTVPVRFWVSDCRTDFIHFSEEVITSL